MSHTDRDTYNQHVIDVRTKIQGGGSLRCTPVLCTRSMYGHIQWLGGAISKTKISTSEGLINRDLEQISKINRKITFLLQ